MSREVRKRTLPKIIIAEEFNSFHHCHFSVHYFTNGSIEDNVKPRIDIDWVFFYVIIKINDDALNIISYLYIFSF